jgi:hypothetical protein
MDPMQQVSSTMPPAGSHEPVPILLPEPKVPAGPTPPRLVTGERTAWAVVYLTILTGLGLQLAKSMGALQRLPESTFQVMTTADAMAGLFASAVTYRSQLQEVKELPEEQRPRRITIARRELAVYFVGFAATLSSLGIQLAGGLGKPIAQMPHVINALAGTGAVMGLVGLLTETQRRIEDDRAEAAARGGEPLPHHVWTHRQGAIAAVAALLTIAGIGLQIADALNRSVPFSDITFTAMVGAAALIMIFNTTLFTYWSELSRHQLLTAPAEPVVVAEPQLPPPLLLPEAPLEGT